jgi:hypothetical protein
MSVVRPISTYLEMSVVFGLSICMARGSNCTVGNENDLLGLVFGGWGVGKILKRMLFCE